MSKLTEFRAQNPAYKDWTDEELAYGLYKKFYSDKPLVGYAKDLGLGKDGTLSFLKYAGQKGDTVSFSETAPSPEVGGTRVGMSRAAFQGGTFGFGDEIVAGGTAVARKALSGDERPMSEIYQQELSRERERIGEFRETDPVKSYGSEFAGGLLVPASAAKNVKQAAAIGAGYGGLAAAGASEGDVMDRLMSVPVGAAMGAILGGAVQVGAKSVEGAVRDYLSAKAQKAAAEGAQSVQQLKDEASDAYQAARQSGVGISPESFNSIIDDIAKKATGGRPISSKLTPKASGVIDEMRSEVDRVLASEAKALGIDDLEYMRQLASIPAKDFQNPAEQRIAGIIQSSIDDFMGKLDADSLVSGSADEAVDALKKARSLWSRMRKTEKIENLLENASTYQGGIESGLRNQISTILRNPKQRAQFNKDEIALLVQIREGTPIGNLIGNIAKAGFSLTGGQSVTGKGVAGATGGLAALGGFAAAGPEGAAIAILLEQGATTGLRYVREMGMQQRVELFRDIVANGLADQVKQANPSAFRALQAAANSATKGTIAATDQPTSDLAEKILK